MAEALVAREFYRVYDLIESRKTNSGKEPGSHQHQALQALHKWYDRKPKESGGILVLPTGGGKTFTATRFLCSRPLSEHYRVLWLAHTHHLLEQASLAFDDNVAQIAEAREQLVTRVVSGTPGHFRIHEIDPTDDVIVATLQTVCHAWREDHPALKGWLAAAQGKLFVVFDEAHHSPAPSYRLLLKQLREQFPAMYLLGLTATPTYTEERKRGWLKQLFPQGILYQAEAARLMAARILAKPVYEEPKTNFTPRFDEREYRKWVGTYQDLPEHIITELAENRDRNVFIADTYNQNRERYGKTLIFADRWHQCEQISQFLRTRGVKVDTVYSHVDAEPIDPVARNRRTSDENARILADFRADKLDVLVNVRMLTEGTDVPSVKTIFVTRPTRSQILFTQMIGRALRGPAFGGTSEAYIVSFIDNWRQLINWAGYSQLAEGIADETMPEYGKRPPLALISIELVQRLARQMDCGVNMTPGPFLSLLPVGWYRIEYQTLVEGSEDINPVRELLVVLEEEVAPYLALVQSLLREDLRDFESERVALVDVAPRLQGWVSRFFPNAASHFGTDLQTDVLAIARHIAQAGSAPAFFPFEEREKHDLDALADQALSQRLDRYVEDQLLRMEYNRADRLWTTIYPTYDLFKSQYDACINRELHAERHGHSPITHALAFVTSRASVGAEPDEALKQQVRERDLFCVCCGESRKRLLQVDHITATYFGGSNLLDNLQLLCSTCNGTKGIKRINFRDPQTDLTTPPDTFLEFEPPRGEKAGNLTDWEKFLRRSINTFYQCGAVHLANLGARGPSYYHWWLELTAGNDPNWLNPHLRPLLERIQEARRRARKQGPVSITIEGPGFTTAYCAEFPELHPPSPKKADDPKAWIRFLRQAINDYLADNALKTIQMGAGEEEDADWLIELREDNEPDWLTPLLPKLMKAVRRVQEEAGGLQLHGFKVLAPGKSAITCTDVGSDDIQSARKVKGYST